MKEPQTKDSPKEQTNGLDLPENIYYNVNVTKQAQYQCRERQIIQHDNIKPRNAQKYLWELNWATASTAEE